MRRVLCIRFPNWPIQCLLRQLRTDGSSAAAVALHTVAPGSAEKSVRGSVVDEDTRFIRALFPASIGGPAIVAVSVDAWVNGVRPGMPLAEARSMAQPLTVPARNDRRGKPQQQLTSQTVEFREWQPQRDREQLQAVAELTRRYAPIVGLDVVPLPDSLLLDITGCGPLFGGEAGLAESLLRELRTAGWQCRIAIAQTVSAVWALTHVETRSSGKEPATRHAAEARALIDRHELPIQIIPPGQHIAEVSRLPVAAARLSLKDLEVLTHLGIRSVGQLLSLPREDLPSRLTAQAVLRIQQLGERIEEAIDPLPEANPVAADWSAEEPATSLADIRHVLRHLTEQVAAQLVRRRIACSSVAAILKCANGIRLPLTAGVVKPTQSADLLHEVLCLRLETQVNQAEHDAQKSVSRQVAQIEHATTSPPTQDEQLGPFHGAGGRRSCGADDALAQDRIRLARNLALPESQSDDHSIVPPGVSFALLAAQPVVAMSIQASLVPMPSSRQKDLFSPTEHIVPQEELAMLVTRLSNRLGPEAVLTVRTNADPRPEFAMTTNPVLPPESSSARQTRLDTAIEQLTEPAANSRPASPVPIRRPLRLLAEPQQIALSEGNAEFPSRVTVLGKVLTLTQFAGPERIQTAWWTDQPCQRDYYQATGPHGNRLWLFKDLQTNLWSLHGVFD